MKNKLQIWKTKAQLFMARLLGLQHLFSDMLTGKETEIRFLRLNLERETRLKVEALEQVRYYEQKALRGVSDAIQLDFDKLSGDYPILIVRAGENCPIDEKTFARMRHQLQSINSKIELILVIKGDVKVEELTDEQLAQSGLIRKDKLEKNEQLV